MGCPITRESEVVRFSGDALRRWRTLREANPAASASETLLWATHEVDPFGEVLGGLEGAVERASGRAAPVLQEDEAAAVFRLVALLRRARADETSLDALHAALDQASEAMQGTVSRELRAPKQEVA